MKKKLTNDTWIWTIIQNPGKNESFLGQHDETNDIKFVPAFYTKESALMCINQLIKDDSLKYEPQAIFYDELMRYVSENGFLIFILDEKGSIVDKIAPEI